MLTSMKQHYLKHQEELGALPAPSRIKMVNESLQNIKAVVKERDTQATDEATRIFKERLAKGTYRYPPGPPLPPGSHCTTSVVEVTLSKRLDEDRIRQLFGRFDVFEDHKGVVSVSIQLPDDVLVKKQEAEQLWTQYMSEKSDTKEYFKWQQMGPSMYDYTEVELVPPSAAVAEGSPSPMIVAAELSSPPPLTQHPPPATTLQRIKRDRQSTLNATLIQLGYFPNITLEKPRYSKVEDIPRPTHPDEIEGPWKAIITYDRRDGLEYALSLGIKHIDGVDVISIQKADVEEDPSAVADEVYQEALRHEMAEEETQMQWPHVPTWKYEYDVYSKKHLADIVQYNYSNVIDYVDREVLMTGKSVWEMPIDVDPTCGGARSVPAHAKRPKRYMNAGISEVGVTDI